MYGKDTLESLQNIFPDISQSTLILKRAQLASHFYNSTFNLTSDTIGKMMTLPKTSPSSNVQHQSVHKTNNQEAVSFSTSTGTTSLAINTVGT